MKPYRITHIDLIEYSGEKIPIDITTFWYRKPLKIVKEELLDQFSKVLKNKVLVGINVKTES